MTNCSTLGVWCLRQLGEDSPRRWRVELCPPPTYGFANKEFEFCDPFRSKSQEELLRWYFEDFSNEPFARTRALEAEALLERYRSSLFKQLRFSKFQGPHINSDENESEDILLRILLTPDQHGIDRLNWEILEQPMAGFPRIQVQRALVLPDDGQHSRTAKSVPGSVFHILVVTARSHVNPDVPPRLTALPLVEALSGIRPGRVVVELVRPATFWELERRLTAGTTTGGFDLVHLDMHGKVDSETGATLDFVDQALSHREPHSADNVAELLSRNGVKWAVLCACRTATPGNTGDIGTSNLALVFLRHGIRGVLAMRYELKAAAAPIITRAFYRALCIEGKSFIESAGAAREALMQNRRRRAKYAEAVDIQDYCVPATYCLPEESSSSASLLLDSDFLAPTVTAPVLFGRDSEVERLEMMLVKPNRVTFVILTGAAGIGKTQILRHLEWWWPRSRLYDCVVHVRARLDEQSTKLESCEVGLAALVEGIAQKLGAEDVIIPARSPVENLNALGVWIETTRCQTTALLLDGIDELYRLGCKTTDTQEKWHDFFRAAQNLSQKATIVMAMTKTDYLVPKELNTCIFPLQATMLPSAAANLILHYSGTHLDLSASGNGPDKDLNNALSALSFNPTAIQCHKNGFTKPFCGLGKILDWSDRYSNSRLSPYLGESGRAEVIIWSVIHDLYGQGQVLNIFGLLLLGFFTRVIPEVESLDLFIAEIDNYRDFEEFEEYFEVCEEFGESAQPCGIPFELWDFMHHRAPTQSNSLARAISNALDLLRAAGLVDFEKGSIMGGQRYYVINPSATQCLRDILMLLIPPLSLFVMLELFKKYQEDRSHKMSRLTKDISVRSGLREYAPLVLTERFTLLSVILHSLNDRLSPDPAPCNQIPIETLYIVWPSSMGDNLLCPELLGSTILKWIRKVKDSEFSEAKIVWPDCQNKLWILNWSVDYTIRCKHPSDFSFVFPLREAVREQQAESRLEHGVKDSAWPERKALWTNFALAVSAGDTARMSAVLQAIKLDRQLSSDDWGWMGPVVDANTRMLAAMPFRSDVSKAPSLETVLHGLSLARKRTASISTNSEQEWAIFSTLRQSLAMLEPFDERTQTADQYIKWHGAIAIRDKFLDDGLLSSLPPGYMARGFRFIDCLGRGDLSRATKTAHKALEAAVAERETHVAATWRGVCEEIERVDAEEGSHEALCAAILEHLSHKPGTELQQAVVTGDYAAAYERVTAALAMTEITAPGGEELRMMKEAAKVLDESRASGEKKKAKWWDVLFRLFRIVRDIKASPEEMSVVHEIGSGTVPEWDVGSSIGK